MSSNQIFKISIISLLVVGIVICAWLVIRPNDVDKTEKVVCTKTGEVIFRHTRPDLAFPVITNDYKVDVGAAQNALDSIAKLKIDISNDASSMREKLNQDNIMFENALKAYFNASNNAPCDDSLRNKYTQFISDMFSKELQLKQLVADIKSNNPQNQNTTDSLPIKSIHDTVRVIVDNTVVKNKNNDIVKDQTQKINKPKIIKKDSVVHAKADTLVITKKPTNDTVKKGNIKFSDLVKVQNIKAQEIKKVVPINKALANFKQIYFKKQ